MRKIGYARVSTPTQNLDRQIAALRSEGCHLIFREKASGKDVRGRPQLEKAIDELGNRDVLVVAEWDRATRSMLDGVHIIERIHARGALIKVLDKPHLDLTTPIGRGFIAFLSALAEDERQRIVKRANDGRRAAKARGARLDGNPSSTATSRQKPSSGSWPARAREHWAGPTRCTMQPFRGSGLLARLLERDCLSPRCNGRFVLKR